MKNLNVASAIGDQISDRLTEEIGKIMGESELKKAISDAIDAKLVEKQEELNQMVQEAIAKKVEEAVKLGLNPPVVEEEIDGQSDEKETKEETTEDGSQKKSVLAKGNTKEIDTLTNKISDLLNEGGELVKESMKPQTPEEYNKIQDRIEEISNQAEEMSDRLFSLMKKRDAHTDLNATFEADLPAKTDNSISSRLAGKNVVIVGIDRDISEDLLNRFKVASVGFKFKDNTDAVVYGKTTKSKLHKAAKAGLEVIPYKDIV